MGNESSPAILRPTAQQPSIETRFLGHRPVIESWFEARWRDVPPPFYASVDLRNAGFKLAAIDTNLFPAGFNNLKPGFQPACAHAIRLEVAKLCPDARGVLVVPENHTRNMYYFESLASLVEILTVAGLKVRVGSLLPDLDQPRVVPLLSGRALTLEPLKRVGNRVGVGDFSPCFVLLNNDLSAGRPAVLEGLEQPVIPPLALGWSNRRKSNHFAHYRQVANEFAAVAEIDPWLIDPIFRNCGCIDFQKREGEDCVVTYVDEVLRTVGEKYTEYGIDQKPFVVVKADSGTYGMAIMAVKSAAEVRDLNRKQRAKMAHAKEGQAVTRVLVQEGVPTVETAGSPPGAAEPVIYMIGPNVVGGFYRVHPERGPTENLNAPGMHFEPMSESEVAPEKTSPQFYAYGVVARLALLAAARELKEVSP
jgi:glutamate--cysteine ligase